MYFGSVRFFKHLIITVIVLSIIIPLLLAITFGVQNSKLKRQIAALDSSSSNSVNMQAPIGGGNDTQGNSPVNESSSNSSQESSASSNSDVEDLGYQNLYPDLFVEPTKKVANPEGNKVVYLTFDDGPSQNTEKILNILDQYNVKATFFVCRHDEEAVKPLYKEIVDRGHTIAIHAANHDYDVIYQSVEAYLEDFNNIFNYVYELTGVKCELFRFPGGSSNVKNADVNKEIAAEMLRRGFTYHDWNVDSGDADSKTKSTQQIIDITLRQAQAKTKSVVLMHDAAAKKYTPDALPTVIQTLLDQGYKFEKLDASVKPFNQIIYSDGN